MGYADDEKQREYQRNWYKNNSKKVIAKTKAARTMRKEIVNDYKTFCEKCGENDSVCLDFHHVGEKVDDISAMVMKAKPVELILAEIAKCIVVCKNCHAKIHRDDCGMNKIVDG